MDRVAFGRRLKAARTACGYSVREFALLSGLGRNYLYVVERGEKMLSIEALRRCSRLLGVTADWLLGLTKEGGPPKRR